jgi:hypothetical protein
MGKWLDAFLQGDASVAISWKDGRPSLAKE